MDPWAAIGASVATGGLSFLGQRETNEANKDLMEGNQSWQTYMSNSAHQREVNDLREAGLNPILSVNKGASTPSGNLAKMENALGAGVSSAVDTMNLTNQMKGTDSQVALQNAQSIAANADAAYKISSAKIRK